MRLPLPRNYLPAAFLALTACVAVSLALDAAGDFPEGLQGPGLTVDESFNVNEGVRLAEGIPLWVEGQLSTRELFGDLNDLPPKKAPFGIHLADHPPLGRIWIGVVHALARSVVPAVENDTPAVISLARVSSAIAFGGLVFLVGVVTSRWYGTTAGVCAGVSLILMPRLFGHAHLAALETTMVLSCTAAVLSVASCWNRESSPSAKNAFLTGLLFGLALLTKIQAVLLPVPVALWALWHWRHKAVVPLLIWGFTGLFVFSLWPWLWLDPVEHFSEYFLRTTERVTTNVWYFGERLQDKNVPWHFPAVMFLVTVPLGLHLLGACGVVCKEADEETPYLKPGLLLANILFPLLLFGFPGVVVYDGARLFLMVFPLWAVFIGRGAADVVARLSRKWSPGKAVFALAVFLVPQAYGLFAYAPFHLSYYNLSVGGLRGAERLGLDPTYWGDSLTRGFLKDVCAALPEGAVVDVMPVLHPAFLPELLRQSPILRKHKIQLRPYHPEKNGPPELVLVFQRKEDLPHPLRDNSEGAAVLAEVRVDGVLLAALYEFGDGRE